MASSIPGFYALVADEGKILIHKPQLTAIERLGGILCHICNNIFAKKRSYDTHYKQHKTEGETVYTCVVCQKQIAGYPSFRNHCYLNHVVKNKFQCEHCDKSFCKLSILNSHVSSVHTYKCSSCDEKFPTKNELNTHKSIHSKAGPVKNDPPYDCITCGTLLKSIDMCETHIDDHSEVVYTCPICNEVLATKTEAISHLTQHYDENIPNEVSHTAPRTDNSIKMLGGIRCCHCDMVFPNRAELDTHFNTDHDEKTIVYTCNVCDKQYDKYLMFGSHCHFHISKDKFQCDQCNKTFPRLSLLVIHTEAFHTASAGSKPFTCDRCGHGFMTRFRLLEHNRIVHEQEENSTKCTHPGCSAVLSNPRELILHRKRHSEAEWWCRACGLQLGCLRAAAAHLAVHRRLRLACPVCGRHYRERHSLRKHVPAHFAALLHVCRVCGRSYAKLSRLVSHQRTHADAPARKHRCHLCPKAFDKPHELRQHDNVHSGRRPFRCTMCPRAFTNNPNWRKHLRRFHRLEPDTIDRLRRERDANIMPPRSDDSADILRVGSPVSDEAGEIRAIVDDIDSMSEELALSRAKAVDGSLYRPMPGDGDVLDAVSECSPVAPVACYSNNEVQYEPQYANISGPEYNLITDPDDHILPHIDPLLTIKPEINMYVHDTKQFDPIQPEIFTVHDTKQNIKSERAIETIQPNTNAFDDKSVYLDNAYGFPSYDINWEPVITKVCGSDTNDLSSMFIC